MTDSMVRNGRVSNPENSQKRYTIVGKDHKYLVQASTLFFSLPFSTEEESSGPFVSEYAASKSSAIKIAFSRYVSLAGKSVEVV